MRFPGFEGEWEVKRLGEIAPLQRGFDLPIDKIKNGKYPVVFSNGTLKFHNEYKVKAPGVITGRSGTIGKIIFVEDDYWPHNTSLWVTDFKTNIPKFIYYFYSQYNLKRFGTGSGVPTLNRNDIHAQTEYFPLPEEQNKIVSFLSLIDEKNLTQNKIIEELETLIKGASQAVFNDDKELYTKTSLGSVCYIKKGEQINISELSKFGPYAVMNGGTTPSGYHSNFNTEADTISISEGGSCGYVQYNKDKFWSGGHCYTLTEVAPSIINKYLYYFLKFSEPQIMSLRIGSGLPNIQKKDLEKFEILVPSYGNQLEIVRKLDLLTDKLEVERDFLALLTKQKQYLLNNLFI